MGLTRIRAGQISNIDYKQSVRVNSTVNVGLTNGTPNTVDGVSLVAGDRILVTGQSTASQNGLYDVTIVGSGSNGTWVRTSDANATGEIAAGMIVMVTEGTLWADTSWKLVTNDPIVVGTTGLQFLLNTGNSISVINANGTPVIASGVSSTVNFTSGNNLLITGNNTSETITFAVSNNPSFTGNIVGASFTTTGTGGNITGANVVLANVVSATGNVYAGNIITTGAITSGTFSGNLVPSVDNAYILGNATNRWANLWLGPGTLYITDSANVANVAELTVKNGILQVNGATGLTANLISGNSTITLANSGNITLNAAGSGNTMVVSSFGTAIQGNLSVSGNVTAAGANTQVQFNNSGNLAATSAFTFNTVGNVLSVTGNVAAANVSASGNVYIAGDLSVAGNINFVPGTYGSFANITAITASADNTAYPILLSTALANSGVSLGSGTSNSRVIISKAGTYRVQYDVGYTVSGGTPVGYFWLRKNGADIPYSQTSVAGTNNTIIQLTGDFIVTAAANDYIELYWATANHNQASLAYTAAQTTPFAMPASPSVIVTVTPVSVY